MEEKKFVNFEKEELAVKEYIKNALGKGKISGVNIEYTPVGEKIVVFTSRPGLVIGRRGEKIDELTRVIKKKFHFDNPHLEVREITIPLLDAHLVADSIALALEREGPIKFKVIAYKTLQDIIRAGALGAEIVLSGKLPSERARSWRFANGYLKKTGDPAKVVDRAISQAKTIPGVVGVKVSILPPNAPLHDRIIINSDLFQEVHAEPIKEENKEAVEEKPKKISKVKRRKSEAHPEENK